MTLSKSSGFILISNESEIIPALLYSISTGPKEFSTCLTISCTSSSFETLAFTIIPEEPLLFISLKTSSASSL